MAKALTTDQAKSKVYELAKQLAEIEKEKRSVMTDFKDRINDVKSEMAAIIEEQEAGNTAGTSTTP
jgi:archaellum component FlaC